VLHSALDIRTAAPDDSTVYINWSSTSSYPNSERCE
jgi:hypothetical protein